MKDRSPITYPAIKALFEKMEAAESPDVLTLEELMSCYYNRPCRRIAPDTDQRYRKYKRGSVLVYKDEVILILNLSDDTTYFPCKSARVIGPKGKYKGLLPGSHFYTNGDISVRILQPFQPVSEMRLALRAYAKGPGLFGKDNNAGSLNGHRCTEAFGLMGGIDARRFKKVLAGVQDGSISLDAEVI